MKSNMWKMAMLAGVATLVLGGLAGCPVPGSQGLSGTWLASLSIYGGHDSVYEGEDVVTYEGEAVQDTEGEGVLVSFEGEHPGSGTIYIPTGSLPVLNPATGQVVSVPASGHNNAFAPQDWWMVDETELEEEKVFTAYLVAQGSSELTFNGKKATAKTVEEKSINGEHAKRITSIDFDVVAGEQISGRDVVSLTLVAEEPVKVTGTISGADVDKERKDAFAKELEDYQAVMEKTLADALESAQQYQGGFFGEGELPDLEADTYAYVIEGAGEARSLYLHRPSFNPAESVSEGEPDEPYLSNVYGLGRVYVK